MNNRIQNRRQRTYQKKKDKEQVEYNQFLSELSKIYGLGENKDSYFSNTTHYNTPSAKLFRNIIYLYLFTSLLAAAQTNNPPSHVHGLRKLKISIGEDVAYSDCKDPTVSIKRITSQLPSSTSMIQKVINTADFQIECVSKEAFGNLPPGYTSALAEYKTEENKILYLADNKIADKKFDKIFHHEFLHGDTARRHRTESCNIEQLPSIKEFSQFKDTAQSLTSKTAVPIWPPTKNNLHRFHNILMADKKLNKVGPLIELQRKIFLGQEMTQSEKLDYVDHLNTLKGTLPFSDTIELPLHVATQVQTYLKKNGALPSKIIMEGVIYTDIKTAHDNLGEYYTGEPANDLITSFLYHYHKAFETYNRLKSYHQDDAAAGEGDAFLRMGLPDTAVERYIPNIWQHLKNEEACCDQGIKSKCYPLYN